MGTNKILAAFALAIGAARQGEVANSMVMS